MHTLSSKPIPTRPALETRSIQCSILEILFLLSVFGSIGRRKKPIIKQSSILVYSALISVDAPATSVCKLTEHFAHSRLHRPLQENQWIGHDFLRLHIHITSTSDMHAAAVRHTIGVPTQILGKVTTWEFIEWQT